MTTEEQRGRRLPPGVYRLDDLAVGDWWTTGRRIVTAADIDRFADLTDDRFEVHMDDEAARRLGFERRIAHGLLVLSLVDGLKNNADVRLEAIASLGWDWTFAAPVLIEDAISARLRVEALRLTSKPGRGIATLAFDVRNQRGETVQRGTNRLMMHARTA